MAKIDLLRGMGTYQTTCHPKKDRNNPDVEPEYPPDAPKACREGKCKHPWEARHWENGRSIRKRFKEKKVGEKYLIDKFGKKDFLKGVISKPYGKMPVLNRYALDVIADLTYLDQTSRTLYLRNLVNHAFPHIGMMRLDMIKFKTIQELIRKLETGDKGNPPVYPGIVDNIVRTSLNHVFRQAIEDGWVTHNPCEGQRIKPIPEANRYVPSPAEIHTIAHTIRPFFRAAIYVMAGAGLREGEMLGLTPDCIKGDHLYVYRQWARNGGYKNLKYDRAGTGRLIPIDPILRAELIRHIETYGVKEDQPLFYSPRNPDQPYTAYTFESLLNMATLELGLKHLKIRPHNFRHAFASHCVDRGVEIAEIAKMLGHKSIEMTYRIYYKMTKNLDRIQASINSFLSEGLPEGVTMPGVNELVPADRAEEIRALTERLELLSGMTVRMEDLDQAA